MGSHTGFRAGELLSLRVGDAWDGHQAKFQVTVAKGYMKGKRRARTMPLHETVREAIKVWMESYALYSLLTPYPSTNASTRAQVRSSMQSTARGASTFPSRHFSPNALHKILVLPTT